MTRKEQFLSAASSPYSRADVALLSEMLMDSWGQTPEALWKDALSFDLARMEDGTIDVSDDDDFEAGTSKKLSFLQFLLLWHRKVFLFLTAVPLDGVTKYLGHKKLDTLAEWRLKIGK